MNAFLKWWFVQNRIFPVGIQMGIGKKLESG
jgi:hypothetical protein